MKSLHETKLSRRKFLHGMFAATLAKSGEQVAELSKLAPEGARIAIPTNLASVINEVNKSVGSCYKYPKMQLMREITSLINRSTGTKDRPQISPNSLFYKTASLLEDERRRASKEILKDLSCMEDEDSQHSIKLIDASIKLLRQIAESDLEKNPSLSESLMNTYADEFGISDDGFTTFSSVEKFFQEGCQDKGAYLKKVCLKTIEALEQEKTILQHGKAFIGLLFQEPALKRAITMDVSTHLSATAMKTELSGVMDRNRIHNIFQQIADGDATKWQKRNMTHESFAELIKSGEIEKFEIAQIRSFLENYLTNSNVHLGTEAEAVEFLEETVILFSIDSTKPFFDQTGMLNVKLYLQGTSEIINLNTLGRDKTIQALQSHLNIEAVEQVAELLRIKSLYTAVES